MELYDRYHSKIGYQDDKIEDVIQNHCTLYLKLQEKDQQPQLLCRSDEQQNSYEKQQLCENINQVVPDNQYLYDEKQQLLKIETIQFCKPWRNCRQKQQQQQLILANDSMIIEMECKNQENEESKYNEQNSLQKQQKKQSLHEYLISQQKNIGINSLENQNKKVIQANFFEWYGNYKNFDSVISKILPSTSSILNIGCGKSLFSEDMYDDGYKNILNVDYSEQVIEDMKKRAEGVRPNLKYEVMDIFNMTYKDKQFQAILDKGCLDAVYPENKQDITEQVVKLFDEITRIGTGRYIIVSLLQEHIIDIIIKYFGTQKQYKISIYETLIEKSKLYPFLIDIEFVKDAEQQVSLSLKGAKEVVKVNYEQCKEEIKKIQLQNHFMSQVKKLRTGQRFNIDLWDNSNQQTPRYSLYIVDSKSKKTLESKTCGCFITPQGKEQSYLFGTERGNFDLLEQTGMSRLIIAILNPGFVFDDLKKVQADISPAINDITPKGCSNTPVPFMTDADELGAKGIMEENKEFILEEIIIDEDVYRRLILKSNFNQVQSQFKLGYHSATNSQKNYLKSLQKECLLPAKKNMFIGIDDSYLDFEAHRSIIAGLSLFKPQNFNVSEFRVLILGGGLCGLGKFLYNHFNHMKITNVEISQAIVDIAKSSFEVQEDERFQLICQNALAYVDKKSHKKKRSKKNKKKSTQIQEKEEENKSEQQEEQENEEEEEQQQEEKSEEVILGNPNGLDYIIIDINSSFGETSPPKEFLSQEFLTKIKKMLKPREGILAINVVAFGENEKKTILEQINQSFDLIYSLQTESDLNEVLFAVNHKFQKQQNNNEEIVVVEAEMICDRKKMDTQFKSHAKLRSKPWDQTLNIEDCLSELKLRTPKITGNKFERNNFHLKSGDNEEMTNKTKEQYQKDLGCINKQQQKKKRKNRQK